MYPNYYPQYQGYTPTVTQPGYSSQASYSMPSYQQLYQQTQQPAFLSGRFIRDISEVTPQEVPMNGSPSVFPVSDASAIYVKSWDNNGNIVTVRYVREEPKTQELTGQLEPTIDTTLANMQEQLDRIEKQVNARYQRYDKNNQRKVQEDTNA